MGRIQNIISALFVILFITDCASPKIMKTANPNIPYTYVNGFKDCVIKPHLSIQDKDSVYVNELKFNAVYCAMYSQKIMYDRFGKWNKVIAMGKGHSTILLWEKVNLFKNNNELYDVVATSTENWKEIYAGVMVFNSKNEDCLSEKSTTKDSIVKYFSDGIKKVKIHDENDKFF